MSNILIGTASWTDKSLIASGRFYPPKCSTPEDRLRYYAWQSPLLRDRNLASNGADIPGQHRGTSFVAHRHL